MHGHTPTRRTIRIIALLVLLFAPACTAVPGAGATGDIPGADAAADQAGAAFGDTSGGSASASVLEQLSLERINRARLRPGQEAAMYGIAIDEGIPGQLSATPRQAVSLNSTLNGTSKGHSQDMLARNYFEHNSPEGVTPFDRMTNAGYLFVSAGENLAWRGTTGTVNEISTVEDQHEDLFVDSDIPDRGHRVTMLNGSFREVGIGVVRGFFTNNGTRYDSIMQTQDYGTSANSPTFILGVVYADSNSNGRYDAGEGQAGSTVSLDEATTSTNSGGGYSFGVNQSGAHTIRFVGNRTQVLDITRGQKNVKVDFVNGNTIVINLGVGILN